MSVGDGLTPAQQQAVAHRGTDCLVSASAGSGKTRVLVTRCIELVCDPRAPCGVDELLVVTFTRAAAAELRDRLSAALRERAATCTDAALRAHLRRQMLAVHAADIGTIDAWCQRILRAHAVAAGMDPDFSILEPQAAAILRREVFAEVLDELCASPDAAGAQVRDWLRRFGGPNGARLREVVLALHALRDRLADPQAWFAARRAELSRTPRELCDEAVGLLGQAISAECDAQRRALRALRDRLPPPAQAVLDDYLARLEDWAAPPHDGEALRARLAQINGYGFLRFRADSAADRAAGKFIDRVLKKYCYKRCLHDGLCRFAEQEVLADPAAAAECLRVALEVEQRFFERLEREKRRRRAWEFADVLRRTLDLLGEPGSGPPRRPTPVALRLRQRYAHVLVDEYQDTSPAQVELLRLVAREPSEAGNRFLVGDIKQSIYGFRLAEPRLFRQTYEQMSSRPECGRVIELADNFRSHPRLVDALNVLFDALFDAEFGGTAGRVRLEARRAEAPGAGDDGPRLEVHVLREADEPAEGLPLESIERQGQFAAARIRALLAGGMTVTAPDGTRRPLRPGDIVILLRAARRKAPLLAGVLRQAGVPAVALGRESMLACLEVQDVLNVLRLLASRRQDVPLAAYLCGPAGGLRWAELLTVRRARPRGRLIDAVRAYCASGGHAPLRDRLVAAMRRLDEWEVVAREQNIAALVRRVLADTDLVHVAHGRPDGAQRVLALEALRDLAARHAAQGAGPAELLAFLERLEEEEAEIESPLRVDPDLVRIMTIHAAKGLEFPVVLLLDAGARFRAGPPEGGLRADLPDAVGLRIWDAAGQRWLATPHYAPAGTALRRRELEEELRLLYVAATRARERLVIIGSGQTQRSSVPSWPEWCARVPAGSRLTALERESAGCMLDWVLMAAAARRDEWETTPPLLEVHDEARLPAGSPGDAAPLTAGPERPQPADAAADGPRAGSSGGPDQRWLADAERYIRHEPDLRAARLPAVVSVSVLKQRAAGTADADLPGRVPDEAAVLAPLTASGRQRAERGAEAGTAVHRLLERAELSALTDRAALEREVRRLRDAGVLTDAQAGALPLDALAWFLGTPLADRLRRAARVYREVPFVFGLPAAGADEPVLLRGVMDCVAVEDGGRLLVPDYKTDRVTGRRRAERLALYRAQVRLYAQAARQMFAAPSCEAWLVLLGERGVEAVPVDAAPVQLPPEWL